MIGKKYSLQTKGVFRNENILKGVIFRKFVSKNLRTNYTVAYA